MRENSFIKKITEQNRKAWNEIAKVRSEKFPSVDYYLNGGVSLDKIVIDVVKEKFDNQCNLKLIHLQCATGEDTLSWAVIGLHADGVDISDEQIKIAQKKAESGGLSARFFTSDVYSLPASLPEDWYGNGYDIVYTGGGAVVWLPDLSLWGKIIADLLRPGGLVVIHEIHPIAACLLNNNGQLVIDDDYFRRNKPMEVEGWFHFTGGKNAQEKKYEFAWPLGDIVTAIAGAGLIIEKLEEFPASPECQLGSDQENFTSLPGQFLLTAVKPHD